MANQELLKRYLLEEIVTQKSDIAEDESLIHSGLLDSMAIMKLIAFLEETYTISITDEDMIMENFDSIQTMMNLVNKQK